MSWPQVALAAINMAQVVLLAALGVWAQRTHRAAVVTRHEIERINGELQAAIASAPEARKGA